VVWASAPAKATTLYEEFKEFRSGSTPRDLTKSKVGALLRPENEPPGASHAVGLRALTMAGALPRCEQPGVPALQSIISSAFAPGRIGSERPCCGRMAVRRWVNQPTLAPDGRRAPRAHHLHPCRLQSHRFRLCMCLRRSDEFQLPATPLPTSMPPRSGAVVLASKGIFNPAVDPLDSTSTHASAGRRRR